jgi:hypothetical protein
MSTQYTAAIQQLYVAYFGRPADTLGLQFWEKAVAASNGSTAAISAQFSTSAEYTSTFNGLSSLQIINQIYTNLFGRPAELEGLTFWAGKLENKEASISTIIGNIVSAASPNDKHIYENKGLAAVAFSEAIDTPEEVLAYNGQSLPVIKGFIASVTDDASLAAAIDPAAMDALTQTVVQTGGASTISNVTLTGNLDVVTANQFFASQTQFNVDGKGPTLNTGDRLTGTAGRTDNTLTITDLTPNVNNNNIPAGVTLKNIQNIVLNTSGNTAGGIGFSTVGYADVRNLSVSSNGGNADIVAATNGAAGTVVTFTHNGFAGNSTIVGGTDVTASTVGGNITIGSTATGVVPLATQISTGAITVNQQGTGAGAVSVFGGTSVTVNTSSSSNTGAINIGNTTTNTGNNSAGAIANASGAVTVTSAGKGAINVFGGSNVTVTNNALNGAGAITVGDSTYKVASNNTTGNVTIVEAAQIAYNGLAGSTNNNVASGAISVFGGASVSITTNAANAINIGNLGVAKEDKLNPTGAITVVNTGIVDDNAAATRGAILITGGTDVAVTTTGADVTIGRGANGAIDQVSNPKGTVTVNETMNGAGFARTVTIDGGTAVTVNAKGQNVVIGSGVASAPTGAVVVNQADIFTGNSGYLNSTNPGNITVNGGTTVTVKTTGGNVNVGAVVGGVNTVASGAVDITRTFSGPGSDSTTVQGGAKVTITTTKTSGDITVGAAAAQAVGFNYNATASGALNAAGTALKDANLAPTGDVTIVNKTVSGTATVYGNGNVNVLANGAQTVTLTGGDVDNIVDVQSILATGGSNAGKAVGVSTIKTVVLDSLQNNDGVAIQSDALTALSLLNNKAVAGNTITITNNTAAHALTLTQGGNTKAATVVDAKAGTVTVTDNGTASSGALRIDAALATAVTVNNAATASLQLGGVASNIAKVTLTGAGATTFAATDVFGAGNLSKALVVDASAATGNVTASIAPITTADTLQQYLGGKGVDTITINSNASGWGNLVKVDGGDGSADILVANYAAGATDVALGNAAAVKGFEILRLGSAANSAGGSYDASGFTEVQTGVAAGSLSISGAASGATLSVRANTATANGDNFGITFAGANTSGTNNALTINLGAGSTAIIAQGGGVKGTGVITANGYEALTVNAVGQTVTAGAATVGDTATINGVASGGAASLSIGGAASLNLTSNIGFTSINASANTGAAAVIDVTGAKVSNSATTFTGGVSQLVATGSNDAATYKALVTLTGTATNNWAIGETATVNINGTTYVFTATAISSAATVAAALAAAINASATTGPVVKTGAANTAGMATVSGGNIVLSSNAAFEVLTSENGTNGTITDVLLGGQQQDVATVGNAAAIVAGETFTVTVNGTAINYVVLAGDVTGTNAQNAATVAGKIAAAITTASPAGVASAVASGNTVLVTSQLGQTNLVAVATDSAADTFTSAASINMATVNNAFVTGAGGGIYKAGLGGSWNTVTHKFSSGSETVTLDASTAKTDTLVLKEGAVVTDNGSKGGVTKFVVGSQAASDVITFRDAADAAAQVKTIVANAVTGVVNTVNGATAMATVLDSSGALNTKLANLTYTISNGVITFSATGGHSLSEFSTGELVSAAQILVSSSTTGGANKVVAFSSNGRSYVVSSDNGNTLAAGTDNKTSIVELKDVASVKGFGSTFGENTIVSDSVANITGAAVDLAALATNSTLDYTGFAVATLNNLTALATANTAITNLAASAELKITGASIGSMGFLSTTQVGSSGNNSLTVTMDTAAKTVERLTVNGDALVKFAVAGATQTVTELVDATNTMNTVSVTGAGNLVLSKVTSTALTTVDATAATGTFTFAAPAAPDAHNALAIKLAVGAASNVYTSGAGDVITQGTATTSGTGLVTLVASGASNVITLSNGNNVVTANGAGDTITVGTGTNTITATGSSDTIVIADSASVTTVTVGTKATVTVGTADVVKVGGAVTGNTTAGDYAITTIKFDAADTTSTTGVFNDKIDFTQAGITVGNLGAAGTMATSQINVASAASLADALNLAANYTLLKQAQGTDVSTANLAANTAVVDWFQYNGDTYVVAMVNNTGAAVQQTKLDANDIVVKLTGLVDLTNAAFAANVLG